MAHWIPIGIWHQSPGPRYHGDNLTRWLISWMYPARCMVMFSNNYKYIKYKKPLKQWWSPDTSLLKHQKHLYITVRKQKSPRLPLRLLALQVSPAEFQAWDVSFLEMVDLEAFFDAFVQIKSDQTIAFYHPEFGHSQGDYTWL